MRARSSAVNEDGVSTSPRTIWLILPSAFTNTAFGSPTEVEVAAGDGRRRGRRPPGTSTPALWMNPLAAADLVLAVDADDPDVRQRTAGLVLGTHRGRQGRQLRVAAGAPVPEEQEHRRRAVPPPSAGHGHLTLARPSAHVGAGERRHRAPRRPPPRPVAPVAVVVPSSVNSPMPSTTARTTPTTRKTLRGLRARRVPHGRHPAPGRRPAAGRARRSWQRTTLVNVVGDQYVTRHGHEETVRYVME